MWYYSWEAQSYFFLVTIPLDSGLIPVREDEVPEWVVRQYELEKRSLLQ